MNLDTNRLILRTMIESDRAPFVATLGDPLVTRFTGGAVSPTRSSKLFDSFLSRRGDSPLTVWTVAFPDVGTYIGHASLERQNDQNIAEIGFHLSSRYWGRGFATEIAKRVVDYGFHDAGLRAIIATVDPDNRASRRVLEKAGFAISRWDEDSEGRYPVYLKTDGRQ